MISNATTYFQSRSEFNWQQTVERNLQAAQVEVSAITSGLKENHLVAYDEGLTRFEKYQRRLDQLQPTFAQLHSKRGNWEARIEQLKKAKAGCLTRILRVGGLDEASLLNGLITRAKVIESAWQTLLERTTEMQRTLMANPAKRAIEQCDEILANHYLGNDRTYEGEIVPSGYTKPQIRQILLHAFQTPLKVGSSTVINVAGKQYVVTRKPHKWSVSAWGHTTVKLGEGCYGIAYKVWSFTKGKWIARKQANPNSHYPLETCNESLIKEVNMLERVHLRGRVQGVFPKMSLRRLETRAGIFYFAHGRFAQHGNLDEALSNHLFNAFTPFEKFRLCEQLLQGLAAVARENIVHNASNATNIFVDSEPTGRKLYLADFGEATIDNNSDAMFKLDVRHIGEALAALLIDRSVPIREFKKWIDENQMKWLVNYDGAYLFHQYPAEVYEWVKNVVAGELTAQKALDTYRQILAKWPVALS